jgi:hypothetical protein
MRPLLVAALACALAAPLPAQSACLTFTDPAGDTVLGPTGIADAEPDLDIVGVQYLTTATSIGARIEVAALGTMPAKAPGDVFQAGFTHAGFYVDLFAERLAGTLVTPSSSPSGLTVSATFDPATSSVTLTVPKSEVEALTGDSLANATLSDLNAGTSAAYGVWLLYDDAYAAPSETYRVGDAC